MSAALVCGVAASGAAADVTTIGQGTCAECQGVAADATGLVYASDYTVHQVLQFSSAGTLLSRTGTNGSGNGQFEGPMGMAVDGSNDLYVADQLRGDVQEFSPTGAFIQKFGPAGSPRAVAADPAGNVYIAGNSSDIYKYSSNGTLLSTWASGVGTNPTFAHIDGIAFNPANDDIYAAEFENNEVLEFTSSGAFVRSWGTFGNAPGELNDPYGLATDQAGNVYVSQPNLIGTNAPMIIQKFSSIGAYISSYAPPEAPEALSYQAPNLYVAESNNVARINLSSPIPSLHASSTRANAGQAITFDASSSSLPFGTIADYSWDLDGSGLYVTDTGGTPTLTHAFAAPGSYKVGVRVTGSSGGVATASVTIDVPAQPPTATITEPSPGQSYTLGQIVPASFACQEAGGGPGIASCTDSNGAAAPTGHLDTSTYGQHTYSVTAISSDGLRTTTTISYAVAPVGAVGFIIDNGDYATNDPNVIVQPVWPLATTSILISNDGGFAATGNATTVPLGTSIPWKLQQTGNDRLPKTVYIRFLGAGIDTQNFTDNIILDETAPTLSSASLVDAPASPASAASASHRFRLRLKAADKIVGLCAVQSSTKRSGGTVTDLTSCRRKGILSLARSVRVRGPVRPRFVRVQNSAGSWSRWLRLK